MAAKDIDTATEYSRGFDRGNYGSQYEGQDWESWSEKNRYEERSAAYREGMLMGFFSSYELHEVPDEELRHELSVLRAIHGDE